MIGASKWRCIPIKELDRVSRIKVAVLAVAIVLVVVGGVYFAVGTLSASKPVAPASVIPKDTVVSLGQNETSCGMRFFSKAQSALMRKQFGSISCIGLISTHQWIVAGDGMQTNSPATPPPPTIGGAMIALETCPPSHPELCRERLVHCRAGLAGLPSKLHV